MSLNAIVGDNGVITNAMNANFLQEMTSVQEAFDMWKTDHYDDNKIPTDGIVQLKDVNENGRLYGEIAYYRRWSESGTRPDKDVLNEDSFDEYNGDLISVPRGVEDLYYLNNKEIGIDSNKVYIIDAVNSMIYKLSGYTMKNVDVHSLAMYREVTGGSVDIRFASAEVEGGGDNIKYVGEKYYKDKNGNYVDENGNIVDEENKVINPYGFEIYTDFRTENVYKLYNSGELYGKGVKGTGLNTPVEEMKRIDASKFSELKIPSQVNGYKKLISGGDAIYFIDKNDDLWALGSNLNNKFGLTQDQQIEYTGREIIKLNVDNKKVDMCWDLYNILYVRTTDNLLYAMGGRTGELNSYLLGNGSKKEVTEFTKVDFDSPEKIENIIESRAGSTRGLVIVECSDNTFYGIGLDSVNSLSKSGDRNQYTGFVPIYDGYEYKYDTNSKKYEKINENYDANWDIDQDIKKVVCPTPGGTTGRGILILKDDGTLWNAQNNKLEQFDKNTIGEGVEDVFSTTDGGFFCLKKDGTVWGTAFGSNPIGLDEINIFDPKPVSLPEDLKESGIKEIYSCTKAVFYLGKNGKLYGSSSNMDFIESDVNPNKVVEMASVGNIESLYRGIENSRFGHQAMGGMVPIFKGNDGKLYSIGYKDILFGNSILETEWKKITDSSVKKIVAGEKNSIAIINSDNDLFVCGEDGRILGLEIGEKKKVDNLTKVDNELINGKVADVSFSRGAMFVLLEDGTLYSTGYFSEDNSSQEWPSGNFPGWKEKEDHYDLFQVGIPKVSKFYSNNQDHIAIANDKIYTWGVNYYGSYLSKNLLPVESGFNTTIGDSNVNKLFISRPATIILLENGSVYIDGGTYGKIYGYTGIGLGNKTLEDKSSSFKGEKVKDFSASHNIALFLTESGKVYGYGYKNQLGVNINTSEITDEIINLPIGGEDEVSQLIVGSQYALVVTKDGKVFGTGSNSYGVLGRWIGVDRNLPNSRYRTAFEWVECPELEL